MKLNKGLKQSGLRVWPEMLARGSRWVFGLLWALPVLASMAFGSPVYATPTISLTIPATPVEIDFSMSEVRSSAFKKSTIIQPVVTTDNPQGYTLYLSSIDENTSLNNGTYDHIDSISTSLNETAFTARTWGYSLDNTNFKPIPKASNPDKIAESQLPATAATPASVNFGVKVAPDLYEGTYQKEIVFTAITNSIRTVSHIDVGQQTAYRMQWISRSNQPVKAIKRGYQAPPAGFDTGLIEAKFELSPPGEPIKTIAWYDRTTQNIYIYSDADEIYVSENAKAMFKDVTEDRDPIDIDLTGINLSKAKDLSDFFARTKINHLNLGDFNLESAENLSNMFYGTKFVNPDSTAIDLSKFNSSRVTNFSRIFAESNLTALNLAGLDTSAATDISGMFQGMQSITSLDLTPLDTRNVTDMSNLFERMTNLTNLNISSLNTSQVTNMGSMFSGLSELTDLDLSHLDTSKVTDMSSMLSGLV